MKIVSITYCFLMRKYCFSLISESDESLSLSSANNPSTFDFESSFNEYLRYFFDSDLYSSMKILPVLLRFPIFSGIKKMDSLFPLGL